MAAEPINFAWTPGLTLDAELIRNDGATAGQAFNFTSGLQVTPAPASYAACVFALTEVGGSGTSGLYQAAIPTTPNPLPAGSWAVIIHSRVVVGTPAMTDPVVSQGSLLNWTGAAEIYQGTADTGDAALQIAANTIDLYVNYTLSSIATAAGGANTYAYAAAQQTLNLPYLIQGSGTAAQFTAGALANAPSGGGSGSGPYATTFTVKDSSSSAAIVGATVLALIGTTPEAQGITGTGGTVTLGLYSATYTFLVAASAYLNFASTGNVITASGNQTVSLVAQPSPTPSPTIGTTMMFLYTDSPNEVLTYQMTCPPTGSGEEFDGTVQTATSTSANLWQVVGYLGASYEITCGNGPTKKFTIPSTASNPWPIPNIISG